MRHNLIFILLIIPVILMGADGDTISYQASGTFPITQPQIISTGSGTLLKSLTGTATASIATLLTATGTTQLIPVAGATASNMRAINFSIVSGTLPLGLFQSGPGYVINTGTVAWPVFNGTALSVTATNTVIRATVFTQ